MKGTGKLAVNILKAIGLGTLIVASFVAPNLPKALSPLIRKIAKDFKTRKGSFVKSLKYLKKRELVSFKEQNGEVILTLTEKGKKVVLKNNIDSMKITRPQKWDGLWRMILFDVPDKYKGARDALRMKFNELGLYRLQKSCYIYPFDCKKEVDFISEIFEISPYVIYLETKRIEGENILKNFFDL